MSEKLRMSLSLSNIVHLKICILCNVGMLCSETLLFTNKMCHIDHLTKEIYGIWQYRAVTLALLNNKWN